MAKFLGCCLVVLIVLAFLSGLWQSLGWWLLVPPPGLALTCASPLLAIRSAEAIGTVSAERAAARAQERTARATYVATLERSLGMGRAGTEVAACPVCGHRCACDAPQHAKA